jgi:hypothetical protein
MKDPDFALHAKVARLERELAEARAEWYAFRDVFGTVAAAKAAIDQARAAIAEREAAFADVADALLPGSTSVGQVVEAARRLRAELDELRGWKARNEEVDRIAAKIEVLADVSVERVKLALALEEAVLRWDATKFEYTWKTTGKDGEIDYPWRDLLDAIAACRKAREGT